MFAIYEIQYSFTHVQDIDIKTVKRRFSNHGRYELNFFNAPALEPCFFF